MKPTSKRIRASLKVIFVFPLIFLGAAGHASMLIAQSAGTFTVTGNMITARTQHTATLLPDGTVLIAGGVGLNAGVPSAEIYDPSTGTFTATGSMAVPRCGNHTATLLGDGKVLIAGGECYPLHTVIAELYDPSTRTFAATGNMIEDAFMATATLLRDGRVLIAEVGANFYSSLAQLYDPATGTFAATGGFVLDNRPAIDCPFSATLLSDGRALFVWGQTAQLYNPAAGTFTVTGGLITYRAGMVTASLLANGEVLVAGGIVWLGEADSDTYSVGLADAELYDPATGTSTATGKMTMPRGNHTATVLPDGTVLIVGGSADIYDPSTGTFTAAGNMITPRFGHTATLLPDGSVLIVGGFDVGGRVTATASAELYKPPLLVPAPVLFSLAGSGRGQGAVLHAGTPLVVSPSNPASVGEALEIYCTGLIDGSVIPPQVAIGGRMTEILFVGKAPGFAGLNQVDVRVPSGVAPGPAVPVRLTYLGRPSNEVTIGVR